MATTRFAPIPCRLATIGRRGANVPCSLECRRAAAASASSSLDVQLAATASVRARFDHVRPARGEADPISCNASSRACEQRQQLDGTLDSLDTLTAFGRFDGAGVAPSVKACSAAIGSFGRASEWRSALASFGSIATARMVPDLIACNTTIAACARGAQWEGALALLDLVSWHGLRPDAISYNASISACGKGGQCEGALLLLQEMRSSLVAPNLISYNAAIRACGRDGQWEGALEILQAMREAGVLPDVVSCNSAIFACARGKAWECALAFVAAMRAQRDIETDAQGASTAPSADMVSYSAAMTACTRGEQWQRALELFVDLRAGACSQPDLQAHNAAAHAFQVGGQAASARALLEDMAVARVNPDSYTYSLAIGACGRGGHWEQALELLGAMRCSGLRLNLVACNTAIGACEQAGKWQEALRLVMSMEASGPEPDAVSYNTALWAASHGGAWREGLILLGRKGARGFAQHRSTLTAIMRLLVGAGVPLVHGARALQLFQGSVNCTVSRLDLEDAARRLESASGRSGRSGAVAGAPLTKTATPPTAAEPVYDALLEVEVDALARELEEETALFEARAPSVLQDLLALLRDACCPVEYDQLQLHGSAVEGTSGGGGDFDVTVVLELQELRRYGCSGPSATPHVAQLAALRVVLKAARGSSLWAVLGAALPAFPIYEPSLALLHRPSESKVDFALSPTRVLGVEKSSILRGMDVGLGNCEVRRLVSLVKMWARRRHVYGQARGYLSGFGFTQLAIFFAQVSGDHAGLAPLLRGFFFFYAEEFDWAQECVSVAAGQRVFKASARFRGLPHLSIEDCVESGKDLGARHLGADQNARLREEMERACRLLRSAAPIAEVFAEV